MYDLDVSYTFHFHEKNTESSTIFLQNDVLILNGKENKEASAICFEIRILKKNNEESLRKVVYATDRKNTNFESFKTNDNTKRKLKVRT